MKENDKVDGFLSMGGYEILICYSLIVWDNIKIWVYYFEFYDDKGRFERMKEFFCWGLEVFIMGR